jgi:hypothetical protein
MPYPLLADAVLLLHFGVVLFVIGGLVAVLIGNMFSNALAWRWVNGGWFRLAHLVAIGIVAVQAWLGQLCPLTVLETWLREQAGSGGYRRSFIEHWVQWLIYYEAPAWVFTTAYTLFALLVLWAWWRWPPRRGR